MTEVQVQSGEAIVKEYTHKWIESLERAEQSIAACFEDAVRRFPHGIAIDSDEWRPTYLELNAAANRLGRRLIGSGAAGDRTAILMQSEPLTILAALAGLKAGRIVVILSPLDPQARLDQIVGHAAPTVVLTDAECEDQARQLSGRAADIVCVDRHSAGESSDNLGIEIDSGAPAFLVYTSGSTGTPKGVIQTQRQLLRNAVVMPEAMGIGGDDRIALLTAMSAGQAVATTWSVLANGVTLCPFPVAVRGVVGLTEWLIDRRITAVVSAAQPFRLLMKTIPDSVRFEYIRCVRLGAEPATSDDFAAFQKHFAADCLLVCSAGSSEVANFAFRRLTAADTVPQGRLSVGLPAKGVELKIVDDDGNECPRGAAGEIVIKSRYLSAGYWRDGKLTDERFAEAPEGNGYRIFRMLDRGRLDADGNLTLLGRADAVVKIGGLRVDPGEIENVLLSFPEMDNAAVCAVETRAGQNQLVAYLVCRRDAVTPRDLRTRLRAVLPRHMVPQAFVFLDEMPLNATGKIDRARLRQIRPQHSGGTGSPPRTETEKLLGRFWQEALEIDSVSSEDDFFDLGGDSLAALVVAARIHAATDVRIDLEAFADHPVLSALAAYVDTRPREAADDDATALAPVPRDGPLPLSLVQELMWKSGPRNTRSRGELVAVRSYRIDGPLDADILRDSINYVVGRHEALRTTFVEVDGEGRQIVHSPVVVDLPVIDLSGTPDPDAEAERRFLSESDRDFDPAAAPPLAFTLLKLGPGRHQLLRANHHLNADAQSWPIFFSEVAAVYEAELRGEPPPLPALPPLQYADFAVWERKSWRPGTARYEAIMAFWENEFRRLPPSLPFPWRRRQVAPGASPNQGMLPWVLDSRLAARIAELASAHGATFYMVCLAALAPLVAGETGKPDVAVRVVATNRGRASLERMIGLFANVSTIVLRCDWRMSFAEWLLVVRQRVLEVQRHSEIPVALVNAEMKLRKLSVPPIPVSLSVMKTEPPLTFGGLELTSGMRSASTPEGRGLRIGIDLRRGKHAVHFDARIFDPARLEEMIEGYCRLLDAATQHPDHALDNLMRMADVGA